MNDLIDQLGRELQTPRSTVRSDSGRRSRSTGRHAAAKTASSRLRGRPRPGRGGRDQHVVRMQVVSQRRLGGVVGEPHTGQPRAVLARPRLTGALPIDLAAQQEPPDPVARAHQIQADVLPAAHQIAQLLTLHRRDRDQRQLPGGQQPGQADCVTLIGLHAIRRRALGLARRAPPSSIPSARARRASP